MQLMMQAYDAVEELSSNLKAEQELIVRQYCSLQHAVLHHLQASLGRGICYNFDVHVCLLKPAPDSRHMTIKLLTLC